MPIRRELDDCVFVSAIVAEDMTEEDGALAPFTIDSRGVIVPIDWTDDHHRAALADWFDHCDRETVSIRKGARGLTSWLRE